MTPLLFSLIPMLFAILGGIVGIFWTLKTKDLDALYSFVSGVLLAAVSTEIIPKFLNVDKPLIIAFAFILGAAFMFLLHALSHLLAGHEEKGRLPLGLIGGSVVDLFVDGILISLAFLASKESGVILAFSLCPCAFLLTMTTAKVLKRSQKRITIHLFILFIAVMVPLGAILGWLFTINISDAFLNEILAFAAAALLYIGVDELLIEHRTQGRSHLASVTFFIGFLGVLCFQI